MPAHQTEITTIEELLALPEDGLRHELLDGEHVVTPSPRPYHQIVLYDLVMVLGAALADRDGLQPFLSPADVMLGPRSLVQPDLFVIAKEPGVSVEAWSDVGVPLLAIEVLSPSTAARDRGKKRRTYETAGVGEYWIVDIDARIIERWKPEDIRPEILDGGFEWILADGTCTPFDPADFFKSLPAAD